MNNPSDNLLASSSLSLNQHRRVGWGNYLYLFQRCLERKRPCVARGSGHVQGLRQRVSRLHGFHVRLTRALAAEPVLLVDDFDAPNGLALNADEGMLYLVDTTHQHIRSFKVSDDGSLSGGEVLLELKGEAGEEGVPDGLKMTSSGHIFCSGPGGIWICDTQGAVLARIMIPEVTANLGWGDADRQTLYITASTSVYKLRCKVSGQTTPV